MLSSFTQSIKRKFIDEFIADVNGSQTTSLANSTFNANTNVVGGIGAGANNVIALTTAAAFSAGQAIIYDVSSGNTAIGGLSPGTQYYIQFANTTVIALAPFVGGGRIRLTPSVKVESGHIIEGPIVRSSTTSNYYVCFGKADPWVDPSNTAVSDINPPQTNTSLQVSYYDVQRNILFGKKVSVSDVAYMTRNIQWTSGTVYDYYDHLNPNLYSSKYFVVNSYGRVYKCLFNNYGAPSTVMPNITSRIGDFTTADGYVWKHMYDISSSLYNKFATPGYVPVTEDIITNGYAEPGAIHIIKVDSSQPGYYSSNGYVVTQVNNFAVQIQNIASPSSGHYNLGTFYINTGTGLGTYAQIANYIVNSHGKFVITTNALPTLDGTSRYIITPYVYIVGDGTGARAIPVVNTFTSSIDSVQMINRGTGYSYANVSFLANNNFVPGTTYAHAIIAPPGGHGSDIRTELGCDTAGISLNFTIADNFPTYVSYRQISLLNNPTSSSNNTLFNDVKFNNIQKMIVSNLSSIFPQGEIVTGFISGATATVLNCTAHELDVYKVSGTFLPNETITGLNTGTIATIGTIIPRDLVINTGYVYYYRNIEPVIREADSSEQVKLFFKA